MAQAKLIFITGPSGSGKSTTAQAIADKWSSTCALLDFDTIRTLIKSGYAEPALAWNDESEQQWELAKKIVIAMAKTYIDNNISVVLEVFATPHDFPKWQILLGTIPYKAFVLLPDLEVVIARNNQREGIAKLSESDIKQNYDWSVGWINASGIIVIDNGSLNVATVATRIIEQSG